MNDDSRASGNEQTSEVNHATKNVEMARSSGDEESKDFVKSPEEDLAARMEALSLHDQHEDHDGPEAKKKKPRKKPKAVEKTENSISTRTRSRIAEFMKANPQ